MFNFFKRTKNGVKNPRHANANGIKNQAQGTKNGVKNGTKNLPTPYSELPAHYKALYHRADAYRHLTVDVLRQQGFRRGEVRIYSAVLEPRYLALPLVCRNTAKLRALAKLDRELSHRTQTSVLLDESPGLLLAQFSLPQNYHTSYTLAQMPDKTAVGLGLRRKPVRFTFDDSAPHTIVAGTTGSGKTTTETATIIALAQTYRRDELQFVILDPKRELADDLHNFSYLAWPVIAVTNEQITLAVQFIAGEFKDRRELPKRERAMLPRLVIIIDEMVLVGDKNGSWADVLDNVARLGRSLKMNLVIGIQEPHKSGSTKMMDGLLLNRFVGLVKSASDSYLVSGKAGLKAHELTGRGDFLHSHPDRGVFRFQAAMATEADIRRLPRGGLATIPEPPPLAAVQKPEPLPTGGRPEIVINPEYLAWYYLRFAERGGWKAARTLAANNGDDIKITRTFHDVHAPFVADFRRWIEKWNNGP